MIDVTADDPIDLDRSHNDRQPIEGDHCGCRVTRGSRIVGTPDPRRAARRRTSGHSDTCLARVVFGAVVEWVYSPRLRQAC